MGVKDLQSTLEEHAKGAVRSMTTNDYMGKRLAIDASILLYQFITKITGSDNEPLKNASGEVTSHLVGLLGRCSKMAEAGIKQVFVFDGMAFTQKAQELEKRRQQKELNEAKAEAARAEGDMAKFKKFAQRAVKVGPEQYQQAIKLLTALGIPCIIAPGEAEALCVALCKAGLCDGVASNDMDCVVYGAPFLVRNVATDKPCIQVEYGRVLADMGLTREQFVDLCILLGTDYVPTLPKVGPKTALTLIRQCGSIEEILASKQTIRPKPEEMTLEQYLEAVKEARRIFEMETALTPEQLEEYSALVKGKKEVKAQEAVNFLVDEMQFDEKNARARVEKFQRLKSAPKQMTLSAFVKKVDRQ